MSFVSKVLLCVNAAIVLVVGLVSYVQSGEKTKITVSEKTTRYTEPLKLDGSLDCVALLNELAGKGVTPENNAAVLLWEILGPSSVPENIREPYFKMLGMKNLPEKGDYLLKSFDISSDPQLLSIEKADVDVLDKEIDEAQKRPWAAEEFPILMKLLRKNEKYLNRVSEVVKRPRFNNPYIQSEDGFSSILQVMLISEYIDLSKQLIARSMLHLKRGREEEAWNDVKTCYRLGQLVSQGPLLEEQLSGSAIKVLALEAMTNVSLVSDLELEKTRKWSAVFQEAYSISAFHKKWAAGEWIFQVGMTYDLSRNPESIIKFEFLWDRTISNALFKLGSDPKMDWDQVLQTMQKNMDRNAAIYSQPNYLAAKKVEEELDKEDQEAFRKASEPKTLEKILSSKATSREKAECFVILFENSGIFKGFSTLYSPTLLDTKTRLTRLALALSAYHGEHHIYPAQLSELSPKYLPEIPNDPFNEQPFHYNPEKDAYLLYSVGINGIDDQGRNYNAEHSSDFLEAGKNHSEAEKARDDLTVRKPSRDTGE